MIRSVLALTVVLLALVANDAAAVPSTWQGGATGDWFDPANWTTPIPPDNDTTTSYEVLVDGNAGQNTTVTVNGTATVNDLTIEAGDRVTVSSGNSLGIGGALSGAVTNQGDLTLTDATISGQITNDGTIAFEGVNGTFGDTTIDGTGAITTQSATQSATLTADPGTSTLTLDGAQTFDAANLQVNFGTLEIAGSVDVTNGSHLEMFGTTLLGAGGTLNTDATSRVGVSGGLVDGIVHTGSGVLDAGGFFGNTEIRNVTNSAMLLVTDTFLNGQITNNGSMAVGTGTYDVAGIDGTGTIFGGSLNGYAAVDAGSVLTLAGAQTFESAVLTVNGGTMEIASTANLTGGSTITMTGGDILGAGGRQQVLTDFGSGIYVTGGQLADIDLTGIGILSVLNGNARNVGIGAGGTLLLGNSTTQGRIVNAGQILGDPLAIGAATELVLDGGAVLTDVTVAAGGALSGGGGITGNLSLLSGGAFAADGLTGILDVTGDLQIGGLVEMEIAGIDIALGQYDQINAFDDSGTGSVEGTATLGGELTVSFLSAFVPSAGDFFDLLTADAIIYDAMMLTLLGLDPELTYSADIVSDGARSVFRLSFLDAQTPPTGVSEPGTLALLLIGLLGIWQRRRS